MGSSPSLATWIRRSLVYEASFLFIIKLLQYVLICDIYINLCYEYDKEISILGFSKLTGINQDTFYDWGNQSSRPSSSACEIYKKLSQEREESLSNMLISGKRNPVGLLGALNRHYGWNMGQPRGATGEQKQNIEQIQERYKVGQTVDQPLLEPPKADF